MGEYTNMRIRLFFHVLRNTQYVSHLTLKQIQLKNKLAACSAHHASLFTLQDADALNRLFYEAGNAKLYKLAAYTQNSSDAFRRLRRRGIDYSLLAAGLGFEPRLMDSESIGLPLADPALSY